MTSTYFRSDLPDWIMRLNETLIPRLQADSTWTCSVADEYRQLARRDDAPYEGDGTHTTFPHHFREVIAGMGGSVTESRREAAYGRWFANGPAGDEALFTAAGPAFANSGWDSAA